MAIYERIKNIRTELGISQKDFGERIGIRDSYVSEIESGNKYPSMLVLLAIEYRFGVSVKWLKTGKGSTYIKEDIKLTKEEMEIIKALREKLELRKTIQLTTEDFKKHETAIKKIADVLKIPFAHAHALLLISEKLKKE